MQVENVPKDPPNVVNVINIEPAVSQSWEESYLELRRSDYVYNQRGGVSNTYLPVPISAGVSLGGGDTFVMAEQIEPVKVPATKLK
jgi:hypothetical protein